jgi:chaperone modulatory protein CbpM
MNTPPDSEPMAELLDEDVTLTLREVCHTCGVHAEYVVELVAEGVLQPGPGAAPHAWRFDGVAVTRIQRALRLQQDLRINLPGVALALELLDEVERLRRAL